VWNNPSDASQSGRVVAGDIAAPTPSMRSWHFNRWLFLLTLD